MLEYSKTILEKVSFDASLFNKELNKAITLLTEEEAIKLRDWCQRRFSFFNEILSGETAQNLQYLA